MKLSRRATLALIPAVVVGWAVNTAGAAAPPRVWQRGVYRRKLRRALNVKHRAGEITTAQYRRARAASSGPRFMDDFADEVIHAAKVAGGFVDNVQEWLARLYDWLIENWDVVLKIILSLLVL